MFTAAARLECVPAPPGFLCPTRTETDGNEEAGLAPDLELGGGFLLHGGNDVHSKTTRGTNASEHKYEYVV